MSNIRECRADDAAAILAIINEAAEAYRGVIPADRWHQPYMSPDQFERERAAGIRFMAYEDEGEVIGVMGIQPVRDFDLIRHAYVLPRCQGRGIGRKLLDHLRAESRPILIGTWAAADWAIRFYEGNGFRLVPPERARELLRKYWDIPDRQIETSVVLADGPVG